MNYQNLFKLDGKVAVVTGGAGILGSEFCAALCEMGATVACVDCNEESLQKMVAELQNRFGKDKISGFLCNIADKASVQKTVSDIIAIFSKIDILLNNAATKSKNIDNFFTAFEDFSLETWREIMSVNLDGMFLMAQAAGKHMLEQKSGVILQTASIYSLMGSDKRIYEGAEYNGQQINNPAVYTASKAGVIGLTRELATNWAEHGIRVNALCPGGVNSGQNNEFSKKYSARIPMNRMATKQDIAGAMLFLVSDASQYMTGQVINVDGGLSAW